MLEIKNSNDDFDIYGYVCKPEILKSNLEIDGKEYAVYSLDNKNGTVDILASYVVKDAEGFDQLVDITNPIDKEKISNLINDKLD